MSRVLEALLSDEAAMEAFAGAFYDSRAPKIGRKTLWRALPIGVRQAVILGVFCAVRSALHSQVSPLAGEPLADAPPIGDELCITLQQIFRTSKFKPSFRFRRGSPGYRNAIAREAAELRTLWRPAVVAGLMACDAIMTQRSGAASLKLQLGGDFA